MTTTIPLPRQSRRLPGTIYQFGEAAGLRFPASAVAYAQGRIPQYADRDAAMLVVLAMAVDNQTTVAEVMRDLRANNVHVHWFTSALADLPTGQAITPAEMRAAEARISVEAAERRISADTARDARERQETAATSARIHAEVAEERRLAVAAFGADHAEMVAVLRDAMERVGQAELYRRLGGDDWSAASWVLAHAEPYTTIIGEPVHDAVLHFGRRFARGRETTPTMHTRVAAARERYAALRAAVDAAVTV